MSAESLAACRVVIAGQPNTGKSTVFSALIGLYQAVATGPENGGETGRTRSQGPERLTVIDLPGAYSLHPEAAGSDDERIAADFFRSETPDLTIVAANACSLERTISYALDVMLLGGPAFVVLNMADIAERNGIVPDPQRMERNLGVPVLATSTTKNGRTAMRQPYERSRRSPPPRTLPPPVLRKRQRPRCKRPGTRD